ncbi:hypothetical protein Pst134EA_011360 [Puccinia striiformis f. sp. tritici]|uniref:Uncharacterized protein n=1 Tax=Puccinia striiformis f. sp. tritici PST-78 TaxID=1165861 RepID=A0A0L0V2N6_9BASI|nr:hypothetical protein Pst134EA_011360 [Puccinia striiformis f. sp. tritici]KAH9456122.1 hypothetical protein Pst134EB_012327 [Puccinia striiformis f. sp. tritici]KAH9467729.1 hypothetical protein Pst134EA_011360 [Puccinia striiformis f. sp. tritici]KAI9604955.1 hypothetical protein H4Q26_002925 [Puccinia striiformis f. sp. tritici PST-130]KNE93532.1 hypothetical protein PSTG_13065 [Puccinia striiformis f. sp. tritici PST-78]
MSRLSLNTAPGLTCVTSNSSFTSVYYAIHNLLRAKNDPSTYSWSRVTLITMLVAHLIMLIMALSVIFVRMANRKFMLGYITRHGVLRPNATGCVTTCYVLYDIFAVVGIGMQLAIDYGISNPEAKVHIPGLKYVIIWIGVWCFCWSTACQYICARWDPPWQSNSSDRKLNIVPYSVIVMLNVIFVGVAVSSVAVIITVFSLANSQYIYLQRAVDSIEMALVQVNMTSANPDIAFQAASNLPGQPLSKLYHLIHQFSHWLKIRITTCLALNSCLLIAYTPFIFSTYRQLKQYERLAPKDWAESKKGPQKHPRPQKKGARIDCKKEMRSLLLTAGAIYSVLLVEWPLLAWEFMHISAGKCRSGDGLAIREMASDVIISIIGNVIIAVILAQTIRIVQPRPWHFLCCIRRKSDPVPNPNDAENGQKEVKKSKFSRAISNNPPVRELTVSVVQVTHSQASEPLEQPNFDLLRNWTQRKTVQDDVIQHHLDLDSALDPQFEEEKDLEMDCLRPKSVYEQLER